MRNDYYSVVQAIRNACMPKGAFRTTFLSNVASLFRQAITRQFTTEGAYFGTPWAPLTTATQKERERKKYNPAHPILRRKQTLLRSIEVAPVAGESAIVIGTNLYYAAWLNYGTKNMEARPILPLSEKHLPKDLITGIRDAYIDTIKKSFLN